MKHCRECDVTLVAGENWTASNAKAGRLICRNCVSLYNAKYRKANAEKIKSWHAENYKANRDKIDARHNRWRKANPEKKRALSAKWAKDNPGKHNAKGAKRRALVKKQTPSWYDHQMVTEIYEVASEFGYHVDHIVPLAKGGLHSHENLQLLTPAENLSKSDSDCWI